MEQVQRTVENLKQHVKRENAQLEPAYYQRSDLLYRHELSQDSNEHILSRKLQVDDASDHLLRSHLMNRTDWRFPGMVIRPANCDWVKDLVALDPLYLVDHNLDLLQSTVDSFTPQYQKRVRTYAIDDIKDHEPLRQLPNNQFGLIVAWNYLNYKSIEVLYHYLADIFVKLRPGGVAIFTYNDCDRGHGAALAESLFMCYTPGSKVKAQAIELGFEILFEHHGQGDVVWLEIKKPGELSSIRGGQTLAELVAHQ
jgi:hypothetical protein